MRIIGYTYRAANYCAGCILNALPTGEGGEYEGWKDLSGQSVESSLSELAYAFQIDRMEEHSFDSDDFPKVIFSSQVEDEEECVTCGAIL